MSDKHRQLGTFDGVFTPTILTIIGVILYLRLGWVVGNVGFIGALTIILLAHICTITTGLALSSMATNVKMGAGGFYSIISRSLGIEIGGAIGITLYLSQALGTALYIIGFTEVLSSFYPDVNTHVVSSFILLALFLLAYVGAKNAIKVQYLIMAIIAISLISFFLGAKDLHTNEFLIHGNSSVPFWTVFAIFFPAVTGISSGASMSGDLKNPRTNIPIGILSGIALGLVIYIAAAFWLATHANAKELIENTFIMKDLALWGGAIVLGVIGATLSSAIGSILAAPRVLMALGEDRILPMSKIWAYKSKIGEPIYSLILTAVIVEASILLADLNTIAPLLTMFFLITYGMINIAVFIEKSIGITSFRPSFNIPVIIPLVGGIWCFVVMFLVNPLFATISLVIIMAVYIIQIKRGLSTPWGDVRAALFNAIAEWAAKTSSKMPQTAKSWKPDFIVPIENPKTWASIMSFIKEIAFPRGSLRVFSFKINGEEEINLDKDNLNGTLTKEELKNQLEDLVSNVRKEGIFVSTAVIQANEFLKGLDIAIQVTKGMYFPPNIIFLTMSPDQNKSIRLAEMIKISSKEELGIIILGLHPKNAFGAKEKVNLWLRDKSPNQNLSTLMAVEIAQQWGSVRLIRVTDKECNKEKELKDLQRIVEEGRMPTRTELTIICGSFKEALKKAPSADINIFGMSDKISTNVMHSIVEDMDTSCLFAMDSGNECILS